MTRITAFLRNVPVLAGVSEPLLERLSEQLRELDVKASLVDPTGQLGADGRRNGRERPPPLGETLARVLLLGSSNTSESARRYANACNPI